MHSEQLKVQAGVAAMTPFEITMIVSILVMGFYGLYGLLSFKRTSSFDEFFLNNRKLTKSNVRNTFTGASISIATVLIFFLTIGIAFGGWIFWSPLTLAIGILAFNYIVYPKITSNKKVISALRGEAAVPIRSLSDFLRYMYDSSFVASMTTFVSACGILSILVAEMMVGVEIYKEYFLQPEWIVLMLGITLFLYAGFGGMKSVVETDRWQVYLICISIFLIVVYISQRIFVLPEETETSITLNDLFLDWTPQAKMPASLWANMLVVNLCLLPSSLRVWQVLAASSKQGKFQRGLFESALIIVAIVVGTLVISKGIIGLTGQPNQSISSIFLFLTDSGGWAAFIIYPIFVAAMLSALVSTADSAILPLSQGTVSFFGKEETFSIKWNMLNILGWILATIFAFWLVKYVLKMDLVNWILTVFSITTCVAPVVVIPLFFKDRKLTKAGNALVGGGIIAALIAAICWSVFFRQDFAMISWNCVIGFGISLILTMTAFWFLSNHDVSNSNMQQETA